MAVDDERPGPPRTPDEFRHWLRDIRERAGFSQETLATMIGTDRRNLHRWERAGHDPGALMLLRIMDAVGQQIVPTPAEGIPRPAGAEIRDLRERLDTLEQHLAANQETMIARISELLVALGVPADGQADPGAVQAALARAVAPALESTIVGAIRAHDAAAQTPPERSARRAAGR